jgi:hypothetical protein
VSAFAENTCGKSDPVDSKCCVPCGGKPCVQVACEPSVKEACPGQTITITGKATNCSSGPETITLTVAGIAEVFPDVPAGETRIKAVQVTHRCASRYMRTDCYGPCPPPPGACYTVSACAENACGKSDPVVSKCCVGCGAKPCVRVSCEPSVKDACPGQTITITGRAYNCSPTPVTITLTVAGTTEVFPDVAPGDTRTKAVQVTHDCGSHDLQTNCYGPCPPPPGTCYTVSACAENACGKSDPVASKCCVGCSGSPCVTVRCATPDCQVQVGRPYRVVGSAANCSPGIEDITITISAPSGVIGSKTFAAVPSGTSVSFGVDRSCQTSCKTTYTISAQATNGCGTSEPKSVCCDVSCIKSTYCRLTMAGSTARMPSGEKRNVFGGTVGSSPDGSWGHVQRAGLQEVFGFHSSDAHWVSGGADGSGGPCHSAGDANWIEFGGTGTYSRYGGQATARATFTARVEDHGKPGLRGWQAGCCGTPDLYRIEVRDAGTGTIVFAASGYLDGGDLEVHDYDHSAGATSGGRGTTPGLQTSGTGDAGTQGNAVATPIELYRATPNPFANTTTIAYAVNQAAGADVSIGIYDVAGRLVRTLASGYQSAGRYEVSWNGRSDDGAGVARGVYFLRAYVGGQHVAADSRILYLR